MPSAAPATSAEELAEKTCKAKHGEVTCFLSHSWRDEDEAPGAKFEVLQRWARRHKEKSGEDDATVWLVRARPLRRLSPQRGSHPPPRPAQDKACIDQVDKKKMQKGVVCLPIFLAGCQKLLILAGPTYCSRLWCVMEIFTFLRMGGTRERIEVNMLMHKDDTDPAAAKKVLKKQFATFDAAKAECFLPNDKHRLLAVVEAGFGDFKEFNQHVRSIFGDRVQETAKTLVPKAHVQPWRPTLFLRRMGNLQETRKTHVQPEEKYEVTWVEAFDSTPSAGAALASSAAPATAKVAPAPPA
jgi:hypothetical protein